MSIPTDTKLRKKVKQNFIHFYEHIDESLSSGENRRKARFY